MDIKKEARNIGQSLWLDDLSRDILLDGALSKLIQTAGITGLTSNPSIFEQAVTRSKYYIDTIERLAASDLSAEAIFEDLLVEDIQRAADLFKDIYAASNGTDGYVSAEVPPALANDRHATVREAERLFSKIGRPNLMIKVPATPEGVKAGYDLLRKGVNVNFTLIFSIARYEETAKAYCEALSWRAANGLDISRPASVASFFVSRLDTAADAELDAFLNSNDESVDSEDVYDLAAAGRGRTAIANCLLAYEKYQNIFSGRDFTLLAAKGAREQRLLWASTGVKNAAYKDTLYADGLFLPDTVNTLPAKALLAFLDHGNPDLAPFEDRLGPAKEHFSALEKAGIDINEMIATLEKEGVEKFMTSHDSIIKNIDLKKQAAAGRGPAADELPTGDHTQALRGLEQMNFVKRLWNKDASIWKTDPGHAKIINNSLGWLDAPFKMMAHIKEIEHFRDEMIADGCTDVVLLGMGGSSLAPEVIRTVFQSSKHPRLRVLDTTDPAWVLNVSGEINLKKTLFIFASKSGGTIEPTSQFKYFWHRLKDAGVKKPGRNFIAITDPGTGLEKLAAEKEFRKVFINFPDIGGRFSALSFFGMVPAALCGADIRKLLEGAVNTANLCKEHDITKNPGALLGALIGSLALNGRDKLTLVMPRKLETFSLWIEQLVAESTGKEGKGVVPICLEKLSEPEKYGQDRFFVHTQLGGTLDQDLAQKLGHIKRSGQPVYTIFINDIYDLGGEFFRWEAATAAAGALMAIDPFDQPNVKEAKDLTLKVLDGMISKRKTAAARPDFSSDRMDVFAAPALKSGQRLDSYEAVLHSVFSALRANDYLCLLAYLPGAPQVERELGGFREALRSRSSAATTLAYGPRYLHSSGQLHKGGADNGLFVILTNQAKKDINIIGEKYTFWQLEMAQAIGDFEALESKGRRVLRIHFKEPADKALRYLSERISKAGRHAPEANPQGEESKMLKLAVKKNTTTKATTTAKTKIINTNEYVVIDYPKNLETITTRNYTLRIGASEAQNVEISIDDTPWQPCRNAVGYWWFDWNNFNTGTHQLLARMTTKNGQYLLSKRRRCKVI